MFVDYHVHSEFSDDSEYPAEQVVLDAISLGLREICFTDHVDYGVKRDWDDPRGVAYRPGGFDEPARIPLANVDYPRYVREITALRDKYADRIRVKLGLEFGVQTETIPQYKRLFARYPFDFIILSVHQIENRELWSQEFQRGRSQREYVEGYYEEILSVVRNFKNYNVLGHLDLIVRYDLAGAYPFEKIEPLLTEILTTVIRDGKGIEINASWARYGLDDLTPSRRILRLYRDLGGEILTVGSDSHKKSHLGAKIPETLTVVKALGFQKICVFDRTKPTFLEIDSLFD